MGAVVDQDHVKPLSIAEQSRRAELEAVITENFSAFCKVGQALAEIRNTQLYRTTHDDFGSYCRDLWDVSRSRAYQLIEAAHVVDNITKIGNMDILPTNEAQVRTLTKLPFAQQIEAWKSVVLEANDEHDGKITAKLVKAKVGEIIGQPVKKAIRAAKDQVASAVLIPEEFQAAFDAFLNQIEAAKQSDWQRVPKQIVLNHLAAITAAIEE